MIRVTVQILANSGDELADVRLAGLGLLEQFPPRLVEEQVGVRHVLAGDVLGDGVHTCGGGKERERESKLLTKGHIHQQRKRDQITKQIIAYILFARNSPYFG